MDKSYNFVIVEQKPRDAIAFLKVLNIIAIAIESVVLCYFLLATSPILAVYHVIFMTPSVLYHYSESAKKSFLLRLLFHVISTFAVMLLIFNIYLVIYGEEFDKLF